MDAKHIGIAKMFEEEVNFLLKGKKEIQPTNKKTIVSSGSISKNLFVKDSLKKRCAKKKKFRRLGSFDCQE